MNEFHIKVNFLLINIQKYKMNITIFLHFISFFGFYLGVDKIILGKKCEGKYYLIHGINNALITYLTFDDIVLIFTDFNTVLSATASMLPSIITYSLHMYHIAVYYKKFNIDDWLHHILMGAALVVAHQFNSGRLINYSLFFTTGLPGMIDYFLLFLVKNNKLEPIVEKRMNNYINLWVRSPGCISHAVLTLLVYNIYKETLLTGYIHQIGYLFTSSMTYWNGIYFMNKVVISYNKNNNNA
jgi:hypothetical protein